jgi:hypothetical protein
MSRVRLTPEIQEQVCTMLALGLPIVTVCEAVGIAPVTYRAWRGRRTAAGTEFRRATDRARARGEVELVGHIAKQARTSWRAASWLLVNAYGWQAKTPAKAEMPAPASPFAEFDELSQRRSRGA